MVNEKLAKGITEHQGAGMPLSIKATRTILNPWYELPARVTVLDPRNPSAPNDQPEITPPCRVDLSKHGIKLFFRDREVVFVSEGDSLAPRHLVYPIRDFLAYRTFINYNLIGPLSKPIIEEMFEEGVAVRFKTERVVRVETTEEKQEDKIVKGFYHEGKEEWIEVSTDDFEHYLSVLNQTLYYAIAFYLIGCDNPRYFLIEFYKAVEVIRKDLGGKGSGSAARFIKALGQYGVTEKDYRTFKCICDDDSREPLDIGRHAPKPDVPLYAVDIRKFHADPRTSDIFQSATSFCRRVIDGYMSIL
jgi:hypothetical protein